MGKKSKLLRLLANIPDVYQKYQEFMVKDVNTLEEFLDKYLITKPETNPISMKKEYMWYPLSMYQEQLDKQGFLIINNMFSTTGNVVSFYKK